MAQALNVPVDTVVSKLTQAYNQHQGLIDNVYSDETWNLQVALVGNELEFRAAFLYKNGKSDQNIIHITEQGQIVESNPQVKVRKDLLEKMESITKKFYGARNKESAPMKREELIKLAQPALVRHFDEVPDNLPKLPIRELMDLGLQYVQADINSGVLDVNNAYADKDKFVFERRIRCGFLRLIEEELKQMQSEGTKVSMDVKIKLMQELTEAKIDGQKILLAVMSNLKYLVDQAMKRRRMVDSSQFHFWMNKIYGFIVYNKSNQPVQYDKFNYITGEKIGVGTIPAYESASLSKRELALILCKPTINFEISNAVVKATGVQQHNTKLEWISNAHCLLPKGQEEQGKIRYKDVSQLPYSEWDRFLDGTKLIKSIDRILKLVYYGNRADDISFRMLCDKVVQYCGMDINVAQEMEAQGIVDTILKTFNIKNAEVTMRRDENNNLQVDITRAKKKGLFGMFKR